MDDLPTLDDLTGLLPDVDPDPRGHAEEAELVALRKRVAELEAMRDRAREHLRTWSEERPGGRSFPEVVLALTDVLREESEGA